MKYEDNDSIPSGVLPETTETLLKAFEMFARRTETQNLILSDISKNTKDTIKFFNERNGLGKMMIEILKEGHEDVDKQLELIIIKLEKLQGHEDKLTDIKAKLDVLGKILLLRITLIIIGGTTAFSAIVYLIQMFTHTGG